MNLVFYVPAIKDNSIHRSIVPISKITNCFGDIVKAGQYTLGQWMDVWFENYAKLKVRLSSHQTYKGNINNHIKPHVGSIPLSKLTSLDLQ